MTEALAAMSAWLDKLEAIDLELLTREQLLQCRQKLAEQRRSMDVLAARAVDELVSRYERISVLFSSAYESTKPRVSVERYLAVAIQS